MESDGSKPILEYITLIACLRDRARASFDTLFKPALMV